VIGYLVAIATLVGIRALLALGLNVQWGMTGLVNLGVVAFFGIGAYTAGLLAVSGVALPLAWVAALATSGIAGAALALAALRLREDYLAIVTLGGAEVLRLFLLNETWLTRGANGITGIPRPLSAWFPAHYDVFYLGLVAAVVALVYAVLERVRRSPFGRVLRAIREDETVAAVAGKAVVRFKVQAFVIGAVIAGLAGVLFGHYLAYIEPNMFLPQETLFVWLALILGGSGNNRGAIAGAVLLLGLLEGSRFAKDAIPFLTGTRLAAAQQMLVGLLLVVLMIRRPEGLLPETTGNGRTPTRTR
jgi:branched-chain amino acid transport system permease protein